jgi:hypothetical protein
MYSEDIAFIYKKNRSYFYGISKRQGKVVFLDTVINKKFPGLSNFFFISYGCEYRHLFEFQSHVKPFLLITDISIEFLSSYRGDISDIKDIIDFFDYKIFVNVVYDGLFDVVLDAFWYQKCSLKDALLRFEQSIK